MGRSSGQTAEAAAGGENGSGSGGPATRMTRLLRRRRRSSSSSSDSSASSSSSSSSSGQDMNNDWDLIKSRLSMLTHVRYLFKLVIVELLIYLVLWYAVNLTYRFLLDNAQRRTFERLVEYFETNLSSFGRDLTFLLGFYVSIVAKRWWDQYRLLPWPDNLALTVTAFVVPHDAESRLLSRTIVRYANLSYVLCVRRFSTNLKNKLPNVESIKKLGLLRDDEAEKLNIADFSNEAKELLVSNWWLPLAWNMVLIKNGHLKKQIPSDVKELVGQVRSFRNGLESVESHVHVAIPLVYKVVVTGAVYIYFLLSLLASQNIFSRGDIDLYFPLFMIFKLILIVGWLKVAQAIEKPFDEDDTDFQMYSLVTRHVRTSNTILDQVDDVPPVMPTTSSSSGGGGGDTGLAPSVTSHDETANQRRPWQPKSTNGSGGPLASQVWPTLESAKYSYNT